MKNEIKILIVEDEFAIALNLKAILQKHHFTVVDMVDCYSDALASSKKFKPQLALVDISLKGEKDGIETATFLSEVFNMSIIFLTAFSQKEIFNRAIMILPEAYITKPFTTDEVVRAVMLAVEKNSTNYKSERPKNIPDTIIVNRGDGMHKIKISQILYIKSDNNYCTFYLKDTKNVLVNNTLKYFEQKLEESNFFRAHQSYLINLAFLERISNRDGLFAILEDGTEVPVSRSNKKTLLEIFTNGQLDQN